MNRLAEGGELTAVEQAVTIGERLRHCWFRGQSKAVGVLLPGAHREPFWSGRIEFWAGQRFRLRASAYTNDVPRWGDHVSWLFWAQHYGVPTRLLDWTENILVALYFAVTGGEASDDGELWCMNHQELKWRSADYKACFPDSPPIRYLAAAAFLRLEDLTEFKSAFGTTTINGPLALIPPLQFPLMAAQMSRFTIHPSREPEAQIEFLLRSASSLIRYVIPSASKNTLARDLRGIGVSHENLYRGSGFACSIDQRGDH